VGHGKTCGQLCTHCGLSSTCRPKGAGASDKAPAQDQVALCVML
jgi:hypothetical protein